MGGFLHLIDFNQGIMARKIVKHNRHVDGHEAPRNSLELPLETFQSYYTGKDDVLYICKDTDDWTDMNSYPNKASMKKLISEDISAKQKSQQNAPSIVARLMGVDMLPSNSKPTGQKVNEKAEKSGVNYSKEGCARKGSVGAVSLSSHSARQLNLDSLPYVEDRDLGQWSSGIKLKPRRRDHPQEEELQKFKKEFEAWQAARFKECSKVVEVGSICSQWLAQEHLNKEKMTLYENSRRLCASKQPVEVKHHMVKESSCRKHSFQQHECENERVPAERYEYSRDKALHRNIELTPLITSQRKLDSSSAPTKIVILRPGPDRIGNCEEPWACSSGTSDERGSIEDFLLEVKERLKCELQGKTSKKGIVRGGGIETPYSEKPSDPRQIAQQIAKQVRESVARDLGMSLLRSESTRSYRSEIHFNGTNSPEFINRDTRRFLSGKLRNVLNGDPSLEIPMVIRGGLRSSVFENGKGRQEQSGAVLNDGNETSYWDRVRDERNMQSRSFRCEPDEDISLHRELSPRNLIRSLSAPVSGTSFGKLLLEDRHVLTGAHIRRKHEAIEKLNFNVKKVKKEKFNIREKVSSFKYSFTLGGRLFGRKIQSVEDLHSNAHDFSKDIMSGPTVVMNSDDRYENSTEVPPSPASVCSSVNEEFWRQADYLSPASTPDFPPSEDNAIPLVFREISSNLNEIRKQLNQLGTGAYEETVLEEQPSEAEVELEDQSDAYIRDLLIVSGLYDGSCNQSYSRWDPLAKPINFQIFEEVEESYRKKTKDHEGSNKDDDDDKKEIDHKMLLDLLNEVLSTILAPPMTVSRFRKKAIGRMPQPPRGRELLDLVRKMIRTYIYPSTDISSKSIDTMVSGDLQSTPWSGLVNDDITDLGKEMASQIFGDLIEETVEHLHS